ncbi:YdcF family protein [Amycolatopsis acidicola]|uniref:YdcF family protein n=1 Tax=Amycolatopsis acidicola TaxID=2596893 RepID=UPI001FB5C672|nr:YdcF family protein [Amycolatopsis acidicola]
MTAVLALAVFVVRAVREPRRLSNAVWLGITLVLALLFLVTTAQDVPWLGGVLRVVLIGALITVSVVLPVALIVNGVLMWQRERRRPANLLSLGAGIGLAVVVTIFVVAGPSPVRWISAAASSVLLLFAYVAFLMGCLLSYAFIYDHLAMPRDVEAIVVAGAGLSGAKVSPLLAARLDKAARLYRRQARAGEPPTVVVSGGQGPGESTTEAAAMRDYLVDEGLPEDRILPEDKATSTEENLRFSADLLRARGKTGKVVAVTNSYHVFRTAVTARRLHLDMAVVGAPTTAYYLPSAFLREFVALLAHYRRTNIAAIAALTVVPWVLAFV